MTTAIRATTWQRLRLTKAELQRMLLAGIVWGLAMSIGLSAMTAWHYGMICLDDVAFTTVVSVMAGILAIGPIAAYGRR